MQDRSSHQGLPEEWTHGSHAAPGPSSGPGASDVHGAGTAGSHRAGNAEGFGTGPADAYAAPATDAPGAGTDSYGAGTDSYGAGTDSYGAGKTDAPWARPADAYGGAGAAHLFGDADRSRDADPFGPRLTAPFGPATAAAGTAHPEAGPTVVTIADPAPSETTDARGFLSALFDFGFTSFVTPKVIRVLYMLIAIGTVLSALVFTILVFRASVAFGILTLVFGDPLFILIVLAIYRIILEFFAVTFRVAEDIRVLRERGDLR